MTPAVLVHSLSFLHPHTLSTPFPYPPLFLFPPPPPRAPLFPYTTLFRSPAPTDLVPGGGAAPGRTARVLRAVLPGADRKSTRLNSSHQIISYAVFCLKKKKNSTNQMTSYAILRWKKTTYTLLSKSPIHHQ